jgi:hypothetical protein
LKICTRNSRNVSSPFAGFGCARRRSSSSRLKSYAPPQPNVVKNPSLTHWASVICRSNGRMCLRNEGVIAFADGSDAPASAS